MGYCQIPMRRFLLFQFHMRKSERWCGRPEPIASWTIRTSTPTSAMLALDGEECVSVPYHLHRRRGSSASLTRKSQFLATRLRASTAAQSAVRRSGWKGTSAPNSGANRLVQTVGRLGKMVRRVGTRVVVGLTVPVSLAVTNKLICTSRARQR